MAWLGGLLTHRVPQQHISEAITCSGTVNELFETGGEPRTRLSTLTRNTDGQLELAGDAFIALT